MWLAQGPIKILLKNGLHRIHFKTKTISNGLNSLVPILKTIDNGILTTSSYSRRMQLRLILTILY